MTNPHNVDICVTCVSEKPPQLPLREELPSLGIEVVYNAHGIGAKASKHEQRRKLKQYQKEKLNKSRSNGSRSFFGRFTGKRDDEEDKRQEEELRVPHALSYSSYQERLERQLDEDGLSKKEREDAGSSVDSSSDTNSTTDCSDGENNLDRYTSPAKEPLPPTMGKEETSKPPIKSLEIPTHSPEELAVLEAFNVFADAAPPSGERTDSDSREALHEVSAPSLNVANIVYSESRQASQTTPTTISTQETGNNRQAMHFEAGTESVQEFMAFVSKPPPDDADESVDPPSMESLEELAAKYLSRHVAGRVTNQSFDEEQIPSPTGGYTNNSRTVKISRIHRDDKVAELYDLTAISDEEKHVFTYNFDRYMDDEASFDTNNDLSTLSSKQNAPLNEEVKVYSTAATESRLPGLSFRFPEEDDSYGRIVMDLSDVVEEDGPGSPLVYSPSQRYNDEMDGHRQRFDRIEGRQDDEIVKPFPSRAADVGRDDYATALGSSPRLQSSRWKSLLDDASSGNYSKQSKQISSGYDRKSGSEYDDGLHLPQKSMASADDRDDKTMLSPNLSRRTPYEPTARQRGLMDGERPPSPSLKPSFSRDSEIKAKLTVSFSHDVDAHFYDGNDEQTSYDETFQLVDQLDSGGLISSSNSDVDVDVDQRFDSLLDRRRKGRHAGGQSRSKKSPDDQLRDAILEGTPTPRDIHKILAENKTFTEEKLYGTDLYPIHAACVLQFPNRFEDGQQCLIKDLVDDIVERKLLMSALVKANPKACSYMDSDNNLPVHILAKQLMEWEAKWYQKVYERARKDNDDHSGHGAGITTLYQSMSQIIDVLLKPLAKEEEYCQQPGGTGFLLPLHIAAIFTVSYDTLKAILETYPRAAGMKCDLANIRTFIPNHSIPLELHSRLSTDFPKWEIEKNHTEPESEIQWTQSTLDRSYGTKGGMRRSDLMFAFYADVSPYRHETPRIRRLEARIKSEVLAMERDEDAELSMAARLIWEWMCTFEGDQKDDHYADSVERVVQSLSFSSVKLLAASLNQFGRPVIDSARSECSDAIIGRLNEVASHMLPVPMDVLSTGFSSRQRSFVLREWEEATANKFCLQGRGFVGSLCRTLFNITESNFPTNFVLLPYKLVKDNEGRLGLQSAEAAGVAIKFADCLLHLTDPSKVLHFLEKKAIRFTGASLGIEASPDWDRVEAKTKQQVSKLLSLYASGQAYFYFLDEYTGVPIVPDKSDDTYPLVISNAVDTVRRALPLMMCGMILMRGDKALSVLADVLLNEHVKMVQNHWIDAARDLVGYLYSPQTEWTTSFLNDLRPLRTKLVDFVEQGASDDAPDIAPDGLSNEWVVELSLIKMIVEMHDSSHSLSGLQPRRAIHQVLWTKEAAFLDPASEEHLFQIGFKSVEELREQSDELDDVALGGPRRRKNIVRSESAPDEETTDVQESSSSTATSGSESDDAGYDLLFQELSFPIRYDQEEESAGMSSMVNNDPWIPEPPAIVRRKLRYASATAPISLINFDDNDLDLDDVLQLRILLDEQEAKLEFLQEKVEDLQDAEKDLLEEEERLTSTLNQVNNQKDILMLNVDGSKGLNSARKLLLRICELEDRVLLRQVEMGQLKNDVTLFSIDAAQKKRLDSLMINDIG